MLTKIAVRNVKRQLGNYLIYFITVSLTIALMFAMNNVMFSDAFVNFADTYGEFKSALMMLTAFIALIVTFVLGYATSFMLKLRKREFGTYLTLGMTRGNILSMFIIETLIICAASLVAGLILGFFIYQALMLLISNLMEIEYAFQSYSAKGLGLTAIIVVVIFTLSILASSFYLRKVSIYNLIHGDKKVSKQVRFPLIWAFLGLISLIIIIVGCIMFYKQIITIMTGFSDGASAIMLWLAAVAVAIIILHIALAKSLVYLMMRSKRIRSNGTNTFVLRQLSGRLTSNAVMAGILSFLIAFAIIGSNVSFTQKASSDASLNKYHPFDIVATDDKDDLQRPNPKVDEQIISSYKPILDKFSYRAFTSGNNYLLSFTHWSGDGYGNLYDSFIPLSDFNKILAKKGQDPITLDGGFKILAIEERTTNFDFSKATLSLNGKTYPYKGTFSNDVVRLSYNYFAAVVEDEYVANLTLQTTYTAYDLEDGKFDAEKLYDELSYYKTLHNGVSYQFSNYSIKEYARIRDNAYAAVFILSALYISVVFIFLAMAILALKSLSTLTEDKVKYGILYRLGASRESQSRALFKEIFFFFLLPFAIPLLMSIPAGIVCAKIMTLSGFVSSVGTVIISSISIAAVTAVIYALYFTATYLISKRNIIRMRI